MGSHILLAPCPLHSDPSLMEVRAAQRGNVPLVVSAMRAAISFILLIPASAAFAAPQDAAPGTSPGGSITQPKVPGTKGVLTPGPSGAKVPLPGGIGPLIQEFSRIPSACPYPDPKAPILRYRVSPAPDGTAVARVQIWRSLASGASELVYSGSKIEGTGGVADPGARADTTAYVLQVTDRRNRSLSQRLPFQYKDPRGLQRNIQPARLRASYDSTRRDYAYELDFSVHALDIRSLEVTLRAYDDRQTERARVAGIRPELRGYSLPTGYIAGSLELQARFRAAIDVTRNYRWSAELSAQVAPPRACSSDVRMPVLSAELTQRGTPSAPPPVGAVVRGSGTSGCAGEGEACTTRPTACAGREASFQVTGRKVCERGTAVCRAEPGRDFCTACGGACGPCVTQLCSISYPCPPGSICGYERTATGTQRRCRSLTVPEASTGRVPCTPRNDICWLPSELTYEPTEKNLAYALYCASR